MLRMGLDQCKTKASCSSSWMSTKLMRIWTRPAAFISSSSESRQGLSLSCDLSANWFCAVHLSSTMAFLRSSILATLSFS